MPSAEFEESSSSSTNPDHFAIRLTEQIRCRTSVSLRSRNPNAPRTSTTTRTRTIPNSEFGFNPTPVQALALSEMRLFPISLTRSSPYSDVRCRIARETYLRIGVWGFAKDHQLRRCFLFRKREPNLHGRAFTTDYHRSTRIVDWRELLLEWSSSKIDRWKRESRDICDDQAVSRIDQHHTVSRIESSRTAKIIDSNIVTSECKFVATPDRVRNQCRQTGD